MMKISACLFGALFVAGPAAAADWAAIHAQLAHIPTVTGQSVLQRMAACNIHINRHDSFIGDQNGDRVLQVMARMPKIPGDDFDPGDVVFRWSLKGPKPTPYSGWATNIETKAPPLGSSVWMRC